MASSFTPKQTLSFNGELLDELQGNMSVQIAERLITMLPPFTSDSHLHDSGCGTGAVTRAVMATNPPRGLKITANDKQDMFLDAYRVTAAANNWPAVAHKMDSAALEFPDGIFSHSIANFLFMNFPYNDDVAAGEMRRTLRKGGVAAATIWEEQPHAVALMAANRAVRGRDAPELPMFNTEWYGGKQIKEAMIKAGFAPEKIKAVEMEAWSAIKDYKRWATIAWSYLGEPADGWTPEDEEE
ncbi:MAG: hypothetical protein Q9227_005599 [Pyrenula ochraceoflavens]